jgi:hypothetical protein
MSGLLLTGLPAKSELIPTAIPASIAGEVLLRWKSEVASDIKSGFLLIEPGSFLLTL